MEVTAAVLYRGALAHYEVEIDQEGACHARLSSYSGARGTTPPDRITLSREGSYWVSDSNDAPLISELGYAIEIKAKPFLEERKRSGGHPAE